MRKFCRSSLSKRYAEYDETKWVTDPVPDPEISTELRSKLAEKTKTFRKRKDFASLFFLNLNWLQIFVEAFNRSFGSKNSNQDENEGRLF